jgi:SAM-dependent methyltransferase
MITTPRSALVSVLLLSLPLACTPSGSSPSASASTSTTTPTTTPSAAPEKVAASPDAESETLESTGGGVTTGAAKTVPDIEYVPTPANVIEKMLEASKIGKDDVLYDLGCGDGRIVVTAAKKLGVKAKGFDIDPVRVAESRENVKKAKVEHLVTIEQKDIFEVDLSPATVVTLYLLPELNVRLIPQLEKLKPGSRIVSHDFDMAGVEPEKWWTVMAPDHRDAKKTREHYVYLWKTPLKKAVAKK